MARILVREARIEPKEVRNRAQAMQEIIVDLSIDKDEWLRIYKGEANLVYAISRDGRSLQFPANILSKYVTHHGIEGSFVISINDAGKFQSIMKL